jgi:hypothetical protein
MKQLEIGTDKGGNNGQSLGVPDFILYKHGFKYPTILVA